MFLTPAQATIAKDLHRFRTLICGRRFGKSSLSAEEIKGKALTTRERRINGMNVDEQTKSNILKMSKQDEYRHRIDYFGPTFDDARDIEWGILKQELDPIIVKINDSRLELIVRNVEGTLNIIRLRSWKNVNNFRGKKTDFLILDEISSYRNFWMNWEEVLRPAMSDYLAEALFTTTPKGFNHAYDLFNKEAADKDYKSFHFTSYDNPYLPRQEIEKARLEMTEDRFAQEYLADFRKTEGLVYKEFDRKKHVYDDDTKIINIVEVFGGVDFGFVNPCAVMTIKRDYNNNFWITNEWYKTGQSEEQIAEYVSALKWNKCYPDPESPSAISNLRKRGVNVREVIKNKDSIKNGIDRIRNLLLNNKLFIHKSCANLITEFEMYSYPEKRDLRNPDENPIPENNHALDSIRYALSMNDSLSTLMASRPKQYIPQNLNRQLRPNVNNLTY